MHMWFPKVPNGYLLYWGAYDIVVFCKGFDNDGHKPS